MDNSAIALSLGWHMETRKINMWSYLGDKPFKMPMNVTVWIAPDGKEYRGLPDFTANNVSSTPPPPASGIK